MKLVEWIKNHEAISSILTIVISLATINQWFISELRNDIKAQNQRIDAMGQRIDHMYVVMMTHLTGIPPREEK